MSTLKSRAAEAVAAGFRKAALARAAGVSSSAVSQWLSGETQTLNGKSVAGLAELTGRSAAWWAEGRNANSGAWKNPQHTKVGIKSGGSPPSLHQQLSHPIGIIDPITISWESLLSVELPERFALVISDEALEPTYPSGAIARFDRSRQPRVGKPVLLKDAKGNVLIRIYEFRTPGHWLAVAEKAGFQPLDSITDGLEIIATMTGHDW